MRTYFVINSNFQNNLIMLKIHILILFIYIFQIQEISGQDGKVMEKKCQL